MTERQETDEQSIQTQNGAEETQMPVATTSSGGGNIVASRRMALNEDLAVAKAVRREKKEHFFDIATDSKTAPTNPLVKVCIGASVVAIVFLVAFVFYSFLSAKSNDADLEEKIMSGDQLESMKALRQHSIQNVVQIFAIVIGILLLSIFVGFGLLMYYKDTAEHQHEKRMSVVRAASNTFEYSEDMMSQLTSNLHVEIEKVGGLERDVDRCTKEISVLNEEKAEDKAKIEELKDEKAKKEAELAEAKAIMKAAEDSLKEAKCREDEFKKDIRDKDQTIKREQQEASRAREESSRFQTALEHSESDARNLRSRARCLEQSQEVYRSRAQQMEVNNARLEEASRHKKKGCCIS